MPPGDPSTRSCARAGSKPAARTNLYLNPQENATSLDLSNGLDWHRWLNGDCPEVVTVALLMPDVMSIIGAKSPNVLAARRCLQKIRHKHGIGAGEAMSIMDAVAMGSIIWFNSQPTSFQFHYKKLETGRRYKLILKVVPFRPEVWLSTFFPSDENTFKSARRKGKLLKE